MAGEVGSELEAEPEDSPNVRFTEEVVVAPSRALKRSPGMKDVRGEEDVLDDDIESKPPFDDTPDKEPELEDPVVLLRFIFSRILFVFAR